MKRHLKKDANMISFQIGRVRRFAWNGDETRRKTAVLIHDAGRVCRPAVELIASTGDVSSSQWSKRCTEVNFTEPTNCQVIVASLYLKDAEEVIQGIPNAKAIQLDVSDDNSLHKYVSQLKKHIVTGSYVDDSMSKLGERAKGVGITILGEMGLDPGIDHMMSMKMINQAHQHGGKIHSFTSYCGDLPSPTAAYNPLGYKFSFVKRYWWKF